MAKKQAVLLIHGIGEQRPMDTLRGFVDTVWTTDDHVKHAHAIAGVYSKPDDISGNFELRRLTTTQNSKGVRTDFYEFYWAHLMPGTTISHVISWTKSILFRSPWKIPKHLLGIWSFMIILLLIIGFFMIQTVLPEKYMLITFPKWITSVIDSKWLTSTISLFTALVALPIIKNIIGDAARYLNPAPNNIHRRQEIRAKGVAVLDKLQKCKDYERVIIVGHSLGSVIGYDILTYAWSKYNELADKKKAHPKLDALEAMVSNGDFKLLDYQRAQRELQKEFVENGMPWLVTDFLTIGSPLTHSEILLAGDRQDLVSKQTERELPICPPVLESGKFSYPDNKAKRIPHHAAVFGPTRWTNLYFPSRLVLFGDLIGGPLRHLFGEGINDVKVRTKLNFGFLTHTLYWTQKKHRAAPSHILALRKALNLLDD